MLQMIRNLVLVSGITALLIACEYKTPVEVRQELEKSLPVGTSKETVVTYLDLNGYEHSAGYKPKLYYEKNKEISAAVPGKRYGILVTARVYVTFKFNDKDRLVEIETREVKTGP